MPEQDPVALKSLMTQKLKPALVVLALVLVLIAPITLKSLFVKDFFPSALSLDSLVDPQNPAVVVRDSGQIITQYTNSPSDILQQDEDYFIYLPAVMNNWHEEPFHFEFRDNKLSVYTQQMVLTIEGGTITYVRDKASGEVLVDTDAYTNRPSVTEGFVGFTSRDADSNFYLRWPTQSSSVSFSRVSSNTVRLMYAPLYFHDTPSNSQLLIDLTVDETTGEVIVQLTGTEANPTLEPFTIDMPIMNMTAPSVILGSGAQYSRADAETTDRSSYDYFGLYAPTMTVVEGANATLAVWSETTQFAPEYIELVHKPSYDHLILHAEQDPKQADRQTIVSPPWRIGTYPTWTRAAKRWREEFEERTDTKPLWENRTPWVRRIHAVFYGTNQLYETDESKYAELASKAPPEKVLYFIWNGGRIVLFGDHTLVDEITRPSPDEVDIIKQYGWPLILYHPYILIYSQEGAPGRLQYLAGKGWLPSGYQFNPDYEGTSENWQDYWTDVRGNYFDGSDYYILHPGSARFKSYLVRNFGNYCAFHRIDGAYLDILGDDSNHFFSNARQVIEGQDFVLGERNVMVKVAQELPHLAVMSEFQSPWVLPFAFYAWEGSETHIRQNDHAQTRINHPLRVALTGSYSWTRESNTEYIDDVVAALLGTLPEISLVGDYEVSKERALWSQARAKLFCDEELFNDLPDEWDEDALAYYRSRSGNWFKFKRLGSSYGYVEVLPSGEEVVRLSK